MSTPRAIDDADAVLRCSKCGGTSLRIGFWNRPLCNDCHPPAGKSLSTRLRPRQQPLSAAKSAKNGDSDASQRSPNATTSNAPHTATNASQGTLPAPSQPSQNTPVVVDPGSPTFTTLEHDMATEHARIDRRHLAMPARIPGPPSWLPMDRKEWTTALRWEHLTQLEPRLAELAETLATGMLPMGLDVPWLWQLHGIDGRLAELVGPRRSETGHTLLFTEGAAVAARTELIFTLFERVAPARRSWIGSRL